MLQNCKWHQPIASQKKDPEEKLIGTLYKEWKLAQPDEIALYYNGHETNITNRESKGGSAVNPAALIKYMFALSISTI